jgi:hypothetical protein
MLSGMPASGCRTGPKWPYCGNAALKDDKICSQGKYELIQYGYRIKEHAEAQGKQMSCAATTDIAMVGV